MTALIPALPERAALLLDFDGTLVEIAPTPDSVRVPPDLPALLERLSARLDGALAIVSGRPLRDLDHFLPIPVVKAGDHGGTLRLAPGAPVESPPLPVPPAEWRQAADDFAAAHPGTLVEDKEHGFVIHYRLAPEAGPAALDLLSALVATAPDRFALLEARMAWEVKPAGISKATAVTALLARAPFLGRTPVFVGDDVTDEAGMAVAVAHGGHGWKLQDVFGDPDGLRGWLAAADRALAGHG
ncbi:trehalose-phosphatase [Roseomonas sp. NAR14]|uniref:Trehalose 6-phosphate phosphatase n=1 Tax=Roseomonas acroporae TaxID=2937791 RepID=A0A9X1YB22_9PROT|nr:trehalose-phosphatase [Roseomonas acroporae]MCK8786427.1 trehalose-phosphatase [Roseomonas acroporae]